MPTEDNVLTYEISARYLNRQKRTVLTLLLLFPAGLVAAAIFLYDVQSLPARAGGLFWQWLIYSGALLVSNRLLIAKVKKNRLLLGENFLQRCSGKMEAPIRFAEITKLLVRRESDGTVRFVRMKTAGGTVTIYGFEGMDMIAQRICAGAENAEKDEKRYRFDYDSPLFMILIFAATIAVLLLSRRWMRGSLAVVLMLGIGVWFLFGKPLSTSQGKRFRALELILGTVIVLLYLLLLFLFIG